MITQSESGREILTFVGWDGRPQEMRAYPRRAGTQQQQSEPEQRPSSARHEEGADGKAQDPRRG